MLYRNDDIVSAAVRLDGVFGYAEIIGNSGVALTFTAQDFNPLFLCSSHMDSSVFGGEIKKPLYRLQTGVGHLRTVVSGRLGANQISRDLVADRVLN